MPISSEQADSGKQKRPPPKRVGPLRVELAFDDALRAALETPPPEAREPRIRPKGPANTKNDEP